MPTTLPTQTTPPTDVAADTASYADDISDAAGKS